MRVLWFSFAMLVLDQVTKTLAYMHIGPGGEPVRVIGELLKFTYTTNPGMAFGLELGSKLFLSVFSLAATLALIVYLWYVRQAPLGYRVALAAVIGGAMGNVVDRTFYGLIYGYAPLFYGEVIDFFHIDLWRGWVEIPLLGPQFIPLFPIWNVADMAIVLGVVAVIVTQGQLQRRMDAARAAETTAEDGPPAEATAEGTQAPSVANGTNDREIFEQPDAPSVSERPRGGEG